MSASDSNTPGTEPFVENEVLETKMTYDKGGLPFYIALIWLTFLTSFVVYLVTYGVPDLRAWLE